MKTIFDINEELNNRGLLLIFDKWDRTIYIPNKENPKIIISETPVANTFQYQYKNEKGVKAVEENYKSIMYRIDDYIRVNTPKEKKVAGEALTDTQEKIALILDSMKDLLLYKNQKYGDSAINPKKIFYKGDSTNSILIRLDDKLGRVMSNPDEKPRINDVADIIGYCTLLMISMGVTPEDIAKFKD